MCFFAFFHFFFLFFFSQSMECDQLNRRSTWNDFGLERAQFCCVVFFARLIHCFFTFSDWLDGKNKSEHTVCGFSATWFENHWISHNAEKKSNICRCAWKNAHWHLDIVIYPETDSTWYDHTGFSNLKKKSLGIFLCCENQCWMVNGAFDHLAGTQSIR